MDIKQIQELVKLINKTNIGEITIEDDVWIGFNSIILKNTRMCTLIYVCTNVYLYWKGQMRHGEAKQFAADITGRVLLCLNHW